MRYLIPATAVVAGAALLCLALWWHLRPANGRHHRNRPPARHPGSGVLPTEHGTPDQETRPLPRPLEPPARGRVPARRPNQPPR